jgi:hypothetical protein
MEAGMSKKFFVRSFLSLFLIVSMSLVNVNIALADDSTPPTAEATQEPTEEPTQPVDEPTSTPEEVSSNEEQVPAEEEASVPSLFPQVPEDTTIVVLDENGEQVPLASQDALDVILEDDPMWCPGTLPPGSPGCRNFTGANGIVNLLTDMRNNTGVYDVSSATIYFTADPGNGSFTLTDAGTSLGANDFTTLKDTNIILQGGWNGNTGNPQYNTQTNFGADYFHIGTSGNPWVGSVTIRNITVDGVTSNTNPSMAVYTTTGPVTLTNILVDDADNQESIRVTTNAGNINLTNVDVTDGDDDYGINLTTNTGSVTLTDVLVDGHTDADAINITATTGNVTLNNADVTGGSNGDGINVSTTTGTVNLNGVDVDGQDGGNGINVTTTTGNINLNDTDVSNQQDGKTANLSSQGGNITVTNNSDFEGDNTNQGFFASTTMGSITITGTNANRIEFIDAEGPGNGTNYNGATLSAPNVTLSYVSSTDNDGNGILINATTSVTLNNVIADNNGTNPNGAGNSIGSGATVIGDGSTLVNVTGGTFTDNDRYGIEVINGTLNFTTMPTFGTDNVLGPYFPGGQDTTGPVITPTVSCIGGAGWGNAGWCRGTVLISWNVVDPNTPVSSETGCNGPFFGSFIVFNNTPLTGQTFTCSATSADGTLSSTNSVTVYRDATAPTASATRAPAPNAYGWNNTDVTVTFSGTDANSGIASCTAPITRSTNGAGQTASGNCTDVAGNVSSTVTVNNINIDKTAPIITFVSRTPANGNGWNTGNVTVTWSCTDALSGVVLANISQTISTEGANQSATGTCQDRADNSASNTQNGINIDRTAPVLNLPASFAVEATGPSGANVNYSASATDLLDGAPSVNCIPASGSVFALGTTSVACTATDHAGNSSNGAFNITVQDTTGPALNLPANITEEATSASGATVNYSASATDVVNGPVAISCLPASGSTFALGTTTVNCSASDAQNNTAYGNFTITVQDTTAPVIAPHADVNSSLQNAAGKKKLDYSIPSTTDAVDGAGIATCTPPSGSLFPFGDTLVTCTAVDSHGNVATPVTFTIHVTLEVVSQVTTAIIPVTGGETIELDCNTQVTILGIKVTFYNLCEQQAILNGVDANSLPGDLPAGFTFVTGLNVAVLDQGELLDPLSTGAGIEMDFPANGTDQFAVLFWNNSQWVEITQSLSEADVAKALSNDAGDELYKIVSSNGDMYKTLTTENTGTFILVKK